MNELNHIAIIMDGNGRWALNKGRKRFYGHQEGFRNLLSLVNYLKNTSLKVLSLYCFSTENWKRPEFEVKYLLKLLNFAFKKLINDFKKENIKIVFSGSKKNLDKTTINLIDRACNLTSNNTGLILNICFNYGSTLEITEAFLDLLNDYNNGKIDINNVTYDTIKEKLYTSNLDNVDLLIRTGKEKRLSNFLLLQSAYAELYFTDTYFPDFNTLKLKEAIASYNNRKRRFGGLDEN